jgi:hypothetical protein
MQDENRVERSYVSPTNPCVNDGKTVHHHELLEMIDGYEPERGTYLMWAGSRY